MTEYILVTAVNRGDQPTTITNLLVHQFASRWKQFRKKGRTFFTLPMGPSGGTAIPHVLQPGTKWIGTLKQAGMNLDDGHIHRFGLMHTASKRGVWQTGKLPPPRWVAPSAPKMITERGAGWAERFKGGGLRKDTGVPSLPMSFGPARERSKPPLGTPFGHLASAA